MSIICRIFNKLIINQLIILDILLRFKFIKMKLINKVFSFIRLNEYLLGLIYYYYTQNLNDFDLILEEYESIDNIKSFLLV
jgi:hypothetical protein